MAIRSFPADVRLQAFFTEEFDNETTSRLNQFFESRGEKTKSSNNDGRRRTGGPTVDGLPAINPSAFALQEKRNREEAKLALLEMSKQFRSDTEMFAPSKEHRHGLMDGFTKEGKGRYKYLNERKLIIPERKYTFPIASSWEYGWKMQTKKPSDKMSAAELRPRYARTRLIRDSFYTPNGIPTLTNPHHRLNTAI